MGKHTHSALVASWHKQTWMEGQSSIFTLLSLSFWRILTKTISTVALQRLLRFSVVTSNLRISKMAFSNQSLDFERKSCACFCRATLPATGSTDDCYITTSPLLFPYCFRSPAATAPPPARASPPFKYLSLPLFSSFLLLSTSSISFGPASHTCIEYHHQAPIQPASNTINPLPALITSLSAFHTANMKSTIGLIALAALAQAAVPNKQLW